MSDITTNSTNVTSTAHDTIPGEITCLVAKLIVWVMLLVSGFYGFKFIGPYLRAVVSGQDTTTVVDISYGYIFVSGVISTVVLFVLIAICENLILINKK